MAPSLLLKDVATIIMGQSPPGSTYNSRGDGLPFFQGATDFGDLYPTPRIYCSAPSRVARPGDVLLSVRAPIGRVNLAKQECAIGRGLAIIRPREAPDSRFLELVLDAEKSRWSALEGGGSVFGNATRSDLESLVIPWPAALERRRIARIVGALDDKIEANTRLVPLLRDLAKALLQQAAEGGPVHTVSDAAEVRKGLSYAGAGLVEPGAGMPMVNLANAENFGWLKRSGFKYYAGLYKPRHIAQPGSLLIAGVEQTWRNEIIGWPMLLPDDAGPALFSQDVFLVDFRPEHAWMRLPLWAHLFTPDARARLEGMVYGTTVARFPAEALTGLEFPVPHQDDPTLEAAEGLLRRAWAAERESTALAQLRDTLLPPLISGELRVRDTTPQVLGSE